MKTSKQELLKAAQIEKFQPEILEKVWWLLDILEEIGKHPFLQNRIALKGGTALNLFYFDVPRLSVDIDLNYIGSTERSKMLLERPKLEKALEAVFSKIGIITHRIPQKHAGGKWQLKYPSHLGGKGNLEVDLNYKFRLPIYDHERKDSWFIGGHSAKNVLLMNYQEIVAGKLTALLARQASRDLFDAYNLLINEKVNFNQLRLLLCVYGAMSSIDFRAVSPENVAFEKIELSQKLIPVLRIDHQEWKNNASFFVEKCREKLKNILPFINQERKFLDLIYNEGKVDASLLTQDSDLIERIQNQPLLKWKSLLSLKILIFFSVFVLSDLFSKPLAEEILLDMSLDEKIGQLFMVPLCPKRTDNHLKDVQKLIQDYHIGGVIIKQSDPETQIKTLNYFQSLSKWPLLVSADAEWGLGMRMEKTISYPKNIFLGSIDDDLIFEMGKEIGRQLKLVGVHINLAPVVDINNNLKNQVIKERVFGKDPNIVARKAKFIVLGMQSQNILCTAKHFPGYGDIEIDPHLDLPKALHSLDRLENMEFIPYKELIENDIACIMTAHILLPNLDSVPVTMSQKITEELLRDILNFQGIIITDALNMKALTNIYLVEEIAMKSHIAGNDILLYGDHIDPNVDDIINRQVPLAFIAIKQAYLSKKLDIERLNEHVLRILKAKERLSLFKNKFIQEFDEKKLNSEYSYKLKEKLEEQINIQIITN